LQSLWTVSPDEMSQDAALSWRYFSDIFASIGVISVPTPRYRRWVALNLHAVQGFHVQRSSAGVHRNRGSDHNGFLRPRSFPTHFTPRNAAYTFHLRSLYG
jgi:hypothetical protein